MKGCQFKSWIFKLREIENSHYFLDSWTQFNLMGSFVHIFFPSRTFYKTLGLLNMKYHIFTQFTRFNKQLIFHYRCSTICSSGTYISY
jgi:hypothetical protein